MYPLMEHQDYAAAMQQEMAKEYRKEPAGISCLT